MIEMSLENISDEIISEILTRLPAKSLCRFKCVSKTWNSIISNPKFISFYISHNSPSVSLFIFNRVISFHTESKKQVTLFNHVNPPNISSLSVNPNTLATNTITNPKCYDVILCSSNGLILFSILIKRNPQKEHEKNPDYFSSTTTEYALFVGNPITREWARLPRPSRPISMAPAVGFITRLDSYGAVEKFMVVEYQTVLSSEFSAVMALLKCYCSDTGKWVQKWSDYMLGMHLWRREGVFEFCGRLVWFDLSVGIIVWDEDPFCFMESKKEKAVCRFISLPSGCRRESNEPGLLESRSVYVGGGFIQYLEVFEEGDHVLKVWRLKGYGSPEEGWALMYNVGRVDVESCFLACELEKSLTMVCFGHPFEVDVAFLEMGECVIPYNFKTRKLGTGASLSVCKWAIPVVLPSWPASVPPRFYAADAKEKGNEYFKDQEFTEAIKSYSRSIAVSPSALAYANRAMAYLKISSFREAEEDCTEALKLDREYFKVYGRRALARKELGYLKGSMEDIEYALKLEPKNQEMIKQHAEIKSLLEKASVI